MQYTVGLPDPTVRPHLSRQCHAQARCRESMVHSGRGGRGSDGGRLLGAAGQSGALVYRGYRSHGAAHSNASRPQHHRDGRAKGHRAAAIRGEGARQRPQRRDRPDRRHRFRQLGDLRRADQHADARPAGRQRAELQPLPHHRALLADAHRAPDRPQSPRQQRRRDHGARDGLPGQHRGATEQRRAAGRDPAPERVQHRRLRQVPRDRRRGKCRSRGPTTAGRPARGSTSSTASSAARPTSGRRRSTTAWSASSCRTIPNYHFTTDMTNQAIAWARFQQSLTPDKPFYMYFAPGATHAPHHVPKEYIAKYKGKFDGGWDKLREETLARQIKLGVVPHGTEADRQAEGDSGLGLALRRSEAAVRAPDGDVCRLRRAHRPRNRAAWSRRIRDMGEIDNTLFFYIVGDNGASAEGGPDGTYNEMLALNGIVSDVRRSSAPRRVGRTEHLSPFLGRLGARQQHAVPVDQAGRVALRRHAQCDGHALARRHQGQGRAPLAVPSRHRRRADGARGGRASRADDGQRHGSARWTASRWSTPWTTPRRRAGARRSISRCSATGRSITTDGSPRRATRFRGWSVPLPPLDRGSLGAVQRRRGLQPGKRPRRRESREAQGAAGALHKEAIRNHVYPMDDRRVERFDAAIAGRPDLMGPRDLAHSSTQA